MNRGLREAAIFVLPLVLFFSLFIFIPVIATFWNSLWQDVSFIPRRFLGFENFLRLFADRQFWQAATFTILFPVFSVALEMVLGMSIALVLNEKMRYRGMLRGIALIPWAIPSVIGARIWQLIYRYDYGLANYFLEQIGFTPINWLGSPVGAFVSLVIADVWRTTPFVAIILLAGLQTVPQDLYMQAKVDGTNLFQRFFKITLPMIKPIVIVALLFRTIDAIRIFDILYIITGGGPGGVTTSISLYGYKFFLLGDFGYGSAISVVLFAMTFALALTFIKCARFKESVL